MRFSAGTIAGSEVRPEDFGVIDGTNDAVYIQQAIDAAENGKTVAFDSNKIYRIKNTIYLGNIYMKSINGSTIQFRIDDDGTNFVRSGTGSLKSVGAILCKSGASAGYGLSTVAITSDPLSIDFNKSTGGVVSGPLLLENTSSFVCSTLSIDADNASTDACNSLDFYQGVQGVDIETASIDLDNGSSTVQGGFWIRNKSAARDTKSIDITTLNITHKGIDEAFAIFNDTNNGDLNNIHIGTATITIPSGGHGLGGSIYNTGTYSAAMYQNIVIDNLTFNVAGFTSSAPTVWKTSACAPSIGHVTINHTGADGGSLGTNVWMIRHVLGSGQTARPHYTQADITLSANVSVSSASYVVDGGSATGAGIDIDTLNISGSATGWTNDIHNVGTIGAGIVNHNTAGNRVDGATAIAAEIHGRIQNCFSFTGKQYLDTSIDSGIAAAISSTAAPTSIIYSPSVLSVTGNGGSTALARVFIAQANPSSNVPCSLKYQIINNDNLSITSPDSVSNKCFFNAWDCFMNVNGTITPRNNGGTKTLSSHAISTTISQYSGAVDTQSGASTDDFTTLSGATIDGQIQALWGANSGHVVTARHGTDNLNLGSDVALQAAPTSVSQILGLRWNAGTSKWDKVTNGGW